MNETIAIWADRIFLIAMSVMIIAATVESVAEGRALAAAIWGMMTMLVVIGWPSPAAGHFGWLE